jgi:hypothetical protein
MEEKKELQLTVADIIRKADIPRELIPAFEQLRVEAFRVAQNVYDDRTVGYNVDHPPYEEMVYGPISLTSEIFKRARRLAALLSPMRTDPLRGADINRVIDIHIDLINYLSWSYALLVLATGYEGHVKSDDAPDYVGTKGAD